MKLCSGILATILLFFTASCFAAPTYIDCPSIETLMASAVFNKARYVDYESRWYMSSAGFQHRLKTWNVWLAAPLAGVTNAEEAMQQGAVYFKTKPVLVMPRPKFEDKYVFCFYTNPSAPDAVMAMTPPLDAAPFRRI